MNTIEWTIQLRLAVALALGFLVGLERESTKVEHQKLILGGVRTYPLISMFGFGCAWLYQIGATFMLPVGLLGLAALASITYHAKIAAGHYGSTSEISAFLTFVTGALALLVDIWAAMALGIFNAILLSEKARLETYVENLNKVEFLATLKFLLVTLIILPVLPNQEYTRFQLNPTRIWEIVILVSTIGFIGYFLSKRFGEKVGLWLSGILGGIVSSTALTIAAGRLAQKNPARGASALQASILAASVMYIRILILVAFVNSAFVPNVWWRLVFLAGAGLALSVRTRKADQGSDTKEMTELQNPFEITPALVFAALFVVLLVVTSAAKTVMGGTGLLVLGAVVGVADVDPFVLSIVQHADDAASIAVPAMIIAVMSNTIAKGAYFGFLVPGERRQTAWRYLTWAALHIPLIFIP